jgi:enoyl-CoA hydratase/carnithine racemase
VADFQIGDISTRMNGYVALLEIHRPPHNHFDEQLLSDMADTFEQLDRDGDCRALVLASEGKSFCGGADFSRRGAERGPRGPAELYDHAVRLFACQKPVVAAIQGAAVGGGLGLALMADFRVCSPQARFVANFVKLGIHPGFGLTYTLPRVIGIQRASLMFYTGRRIRGDEAVQWGLGDVLAPSDQVRNEALALAAEIAEGAPLAVASTRAAMRSGLVEAIKAHTDHEAAEQQRLFLTEDHKEGVKAVSERRPGRFLGR